jgi:hypothetical protein
MKRIITGTLAAAGAALALAGCNDDSFVPEAEDLVASAAGAYAGTLADDPAGATDFQAIVLDDGTFWTFYGQAGASTFQVQGFARGSGISGEGTFDSVEAVDFGFIPPAALALEATYDAGAGTIDGSYTTVSGTTTFSGGPIPDAGYDFGTPATLTLLAGAWDVADAEGTTYTLDVAADGTFDLAEQGGGCTASGTFAPDDSGKGAFAVAVNYDDVVECTLQDGSAGGIALAYTYTGAATDQLLIAVNDADTFGMALSGTRPSP